MVMERSCVTVSTWMVDSVCVQLPVTEVYLGLNNHPGQLSLAIPPWVGGMILAMVLRPLPGKKTASSA